MQNSLNLLNKNEKLKFFIILSFLLIGSFLEVLSYGLVVPLLNLILVEKETILNFELIKNFKSIQTYLLLKTKKDIITSFIIFFCIFFVIKNIYIILISFFREKIFFGIKSRLSTFFHSEYLLGPYSKFIKKNSAYYINNILNEVSNAVEKGIRALINVINETIMITFFLFGLIYLNFQLTMIIFVTFISIFSLYLFFSKKINSKYAKIRQLNDFNQIKNLNESFSMFKYLKIHQIEEYFINLFKFSNQNVNKAGRIEIFLNDLPKNFYEIISIFILSMSIFYFVNENKNINELVPFLGFLIVAIGRIIPSLTRITNSLQGIRFAKPSILLLKNEIKKISEFKKDIFILPKKNFEKIELNNICFSYGKFEIFDNLNFSIQNGDSLGIAGPTGSGKSTCIDILSGLLKPNSGKIYLNNELIKQPLYKIINIGYVPQNIFLFDGTIRDNLFFNEINKKKIDQVFIEKVFKALYLEEFLNLRNGLDTHLGENATNISGGQKQRLGIARAIIQKPDILILDEATNAINEDLQIKILENLQKMKITLCMIAHNANLIEKCKNKIFINTKFSKDSDNKI